MRDVIVVGGGPAGLSAALFTAKNGLDTLVFDTDDTSLHKAYLYNYLGIEGIHGTDFVERAREQVEDHGAELRVGEEHAVTGVDQRLRGGFTVATDYDDFEAEYLVLATGYARELAETLGCEFETIHDTEVVTVDRNQETTVDDVYAVGWTVRPEKIQVAISVGTGAAAGLDILSTERGEVYHDFDFPQDQ